MRRAVEIDPAKSQEAQLLEPAKGARGVTIGMIAKSQSNPFSSRPKGAETPRDS